jgi:glyoxylase-like metal-dependent hydrolase (beta-lactamase superfamily II)
MIKSFSLLALVLISIAQAAASVQKIGPDLYAYISDNDSSSNSTFLVGDKGILVVDTGLNAQEDRKLLDEIRKISPLPVRWIVNTHYHPDHRGGNSVVGPDALIISTSYTRQQVLKGNKEQKAEERQSPDYQLNETLNGEISLFVGSHEVRIYHPGPAHTRGDLMVYFPEQHAIATGDLFLTNSCPYMDDGDLDNWIVALNDVLDLPVEHVVPGHFGVATKKEVAFFRDYLAELRAQVARLYRRNMSLDQTKAALKLDRFKSLRQFPQYEATFADNAAAYYRQLEARRRHNEGAPRARSKQTNHGAISEMSRLENIQPRRGGMI